MKRLSLLLALVCLTSIPCCCQEAASAQQKNGEHATASQQRDSYQEKAEARLRELKRQIDALNAKASKQSSEARKEFDRQIADLDRQRAIAQKQLDKLKASSQQAWHDMKPNLEAAMKNLEAAYQRAAADFKK
jgi:chromosome segregation ATPase